MTRGDYDRAWSLLAAGFDDRTIRRITKLSRAQLHSLYVNGLPARGRRKALPSFKQRLVDFVAAIRGLKVSVKIEGPES